MVTQNLHLEIFLSATATVPKAETPMKQTFCNTFKLRTTTQKASLRTAQLHELLGMGKMEVEITQCSNWKQHFSIEVMGKLTSTANIKNKQTNKQEITQKTEVFQNFLIKQQIL